MFSFRHKKSRPPKRGGSAEELIFLASDPKVTPNGQIGDFFSFAKSRKKADIFAISAFSCGKLHRFRYRTTVSNTDDIINSLNTARINLITNQQHF